MDAFYASVEVLDNPELKGKPVIVGGNRERGVVSAASYEAREFGVHSAMPISIAMRRCPEGIFLPVRMSRYKQISTMIFNIFKQFTPLVESISLDEAFLDVTSSTRLFGPAEEVAMAIKKQIVDQTGLTASAGVASSKLVAKIASDFKKPDGLTVVPAGQEQSFLAPLPISRLWGVGKATRGTLSLLGVKTIDDLRRLPADLLERKFGKHGLALYNSARGTDDRQVTPTREIKSIGHEETFDVDLLEIETIQKELLALAEKVARRMRKYEMTGKCITLKVKYSDFQQITRNRTISAPTNDGKEIMRRIITLLPKTKAGKKPIRLLGISVSHLYPSGMAQPSLFQNQINVLKRKQVNIAIDDINTKFGNGTVLPGRLVEG